MDISCILIPTFLPASISLSNLWKPNGVSHTLRDVKTTISHCGQSQATPQILQPGVASCFHLLLKEQKREQQWKREKQYEHSEQGDSRQQDSPQALFLGRAAVALYLLARHLLNPPNSPASLTSANLSQTHPVSASSSKSGRAPENSCFGTRCRCLGKLSQIFDVQRIISPHQWKMNTI